MIVVGGINDCATKNTQTDNYKLTLVNDNNLVDHIIDQFEGVDRHIRSESPEARVAFCDLIGMNINTANNLCTVTKSSLTALS